MRTLRLVLLAAVLLAGAAFHHSGAAYTSIRVAYYAVIVGGIGFALWRRSVAKRETMDGTAPAAMGVAGDGHRPDPPTRTPGWYPDQQDMTIQRHWDGSTWTATRRWTGHEWVDT